MELAEQWCDVIGPPRPRGGNQPSGGVKGGLEAGARPSDDQEFQSIQNNLNSNSQRKIADNENTN